MRNLFRFVLSAATTLACSSAVCAAPKPVTVAASFNDAARTRLLQTIADAKTEIVQDTSARATQVALLSAAQLALTQDSAELQKAQETDARLNATAVTLRRDAYEISNMPGLSAAQNHRSVAAMEAADAAENVARAADLTVATKTAAVVHDRTEADRFTTAIASLDQRIAACNQLVKLNGIALQYASRGTTVDR